jgi:hypothetical protein
MAGAWRGAGADKKRHAGAGMMGRLPLKLIAVVSLAGILAIAFVEMEKTPGCPASGMSASGQDPQGLEAKPASATREAGDAQ